MAPKLSRESVVNGIKSVGKLRIKTTHGTILTASVLFLILFISFTIRVLPIRWEIQATEQTGQLHLSEFDPFYQYSLTNHMVNFGLLSPFVPQSNGDPQWIDRQRWYPDGINMGQSLVSLPLTAAFFYDILSALGVNIDLMSFCSLFPAIFGTLTVLVLYFLGKDVGGKAVGMLAALFLALSSAFIQRTALGFFDTETIGIFSLVLFSLLFLRSIEADRSIGSSMTYAIASGLALAYFIGGWGAAYYLIGLTTLFAFVLVLLRRYSQRLLLSYSVSFGLGLFIAVNIPYLGTHYLTSFAVLPVAGVFVVLCLVEATRHLTSARAKVSLVAILLIALIAGFSVLWSFGYMTQIAGKFTSVLDPFVRSANPLVESVAEHKVSAWGSIYYELGIMILFFAAGLFFATRNLNNRNLFFLLFGITALYFASSMVRLLAVLAPAFGVLAGIGIIGILKPFFTLVREPTRMVSKKISLGHVGKEYSGFAIFMIFLLLVLTFAISPQTGGIPKVYRQAYAPVTVTASSLPIAPNAPVEQWLDMLVFLKNLKSSTTVVAAWWDYGYWLAIMGNVTSLADNATINGTQIQNVGFMMMANETNSIKMLRAYNAKYILVFTTASSSNGQFIGYGDEGKWTWMARISGESNWADLVNRGFIAEQDTWVNETKFGEYNSTSNAWMWNDQGVNSTVYKLMADAKHQWITAQRSDLTDSDFYAAPTYFRPAYIAGLTLTTTEAQNYGGIVPLVALYEVDYAKYDAGG